MSLLIRIRKDVVRKFGGEFVSRFASLIFFMYVGRKLHPAAFGSLGVALSAAGMLGVVILDPGLCLATIQSMVETPQKGQQIAGTVLALKILLFVPMLLAVAAAATVFAAYLPALLLMLIAALYTFANHILEYLSAITNAFHRMEIEAFVKIVNRFSIVGFGMLALLFGSVAAVLWAMALATGLCSALAWILVKRNCVPLRFSWDWTLVRQVVIIGLPIAATFLVGTIYLKWDLVFLSFFKIGREQIGWYAASFDLVEAFSAIPTIIGAALFPTMVHLRGHSPHDLDRLLRIATKVILLVPIPVAACISAFSPWFIRLLYGTSYLPGAAVLRVLIWSIVPMFVYFYLIFVNIAAGNAKHNAIAGGVALLVGLLLNLLLIPRIGYVGAAWSALLANLSFALLAVWKVCREFRKARIPASLVRICLAGLLMVAIARFVPGPVVVQFGVGLAAYFLGLVLLGSLGSEDLTMLRALRASSTGTANARL